MYDPPKLALTTRSPAEITVEGKPDGSNQVKKVKRGPSTTGITTLNALHRVCVHYSTADDLVNRVSVVSTCRPQRECLLK